MKIGRQIIALSLIGAGFIAGLLVDRILAIQWLALGLYAIPYSIGIYNGLKNVIKSIRKRTIDIDLLMLLAAVGAAIIGEYYEGALLLLLFALSNFLQDLSIGKTRSAINKLIQLRPDSATVRRQGKLQKMPLDEIQVGEQIMLYPGERVGLDSIIIEGEAMLDRSFITGESQLVSATPSMQIEAGTLIMGGSILMQVKRVAAESTISRIIALVENARKRKTAAQRFLERYEGIYAVLVIVITALTFVLLSTLSGESNTAFYRAITLMVVLSPCAIIISTPVTILSAIAVAARHGILFKGGIYLERAANIQALACDKTGTLTTGRQRIVKVELLQNEAPVELSKKRWNGNQKEFIALAASIEARSEHALAQALTRRAQQAQLDIQEISAFRAIAGRGVEAEIDGERFRAGNLSLLEGYQCYGIASARQKIAAHAADHHTSIVVAQILSATEALLLGIIAFADRLREGAPRLIAELHQRGIKTVLVSGDVTPVVNKVAQKVGIDERYGEVLPEEKLKIIGRLQQRYRAVAMFGDGINDAPALAQADIGIAMGDSGVDVALESADIVLMSEHIEALPFIVDLSHRVRRTFIVNALAICSLMLFMGTATLLNILPLPLAVVGHEGSTVLAALYGLRLLLARKPHASTIPHHAEAS